MASDKAHFESSTLRERIVEHVFIGEALRALWRCGVFDVELMRSEFDAHGYDLALVRGPLIRHIQFKTGTSRKPGAVSVAEALATKPSGCVIWIRVSPGLEMDSFFWFGSPPGRPLPPISAYANPLRATRNKQGQRPPRLRHRLVPGEAFQELLTLDQVLNALFGEMK